MAHQIHHNGHIPTISIDAEGFVRCDGQVIGRRVAREGEVFLQVMDKDKRRSAERGTPYMEIPMTVLLDAMQWDWEQNP